jgi:hypothetical protein
MVEGWRELWSAGTGAQTSGFFPFGFVQVKPRFSPRSFRALTAGICCRKQLIHIYIICSPPHVADAILMISVMPSWAWGAASGVPAIRSRDQLPLQLNSIGNGTVYDGPTDPTHGDPYSPAWGYAGLRWAQTAGYGRVPNPAQPNVFMAVSVDTPDRPFPFRSPLNGNFDPGCNVHSPFKQPTAARLSRAGLAAHYKMSFGAAAVASF